MKLRQKAIQDAINNQLLNTQDSKKTSSGLFHTKTLSLYETKNQAHYPGENSIGTLR